MLSIMKIRTTGYILTQTREDALGMLSLDISHSKGGQNCIPQCHEDKDN